MEKNERIDLLKTIAHDNLPVRAIDWLIENGFCTAPASAKYHGSYEGGLFDHSIAVTKELVKLTKANGLIWQNRRSPYVIGLLHDVCKIDQYELVSPENPDGRTFYRYVPNTLLSGHGDKSVAIALSLMELTREEIDCINHHMGAYGNTETERAFTIAVRRNSNVLWTHLADMIVAHLQGV